MRNDEVKRKTINDFMTEEKDYQGEVDVVHFLTFLRDQVGWDKIRAKVKVPLSGLKVATYYGCTLVRPRDVSIDPAGSEKVLPEFLQVLGAAPVDFPASTLCCGSYQILANPDAAMDVSAMILEGAVKAGAEALVLSCPLCDYNLGKKQSELLAKNKISTEVPVFYFTQLLALALGLDKDACRFDLTEKIGTELLKAKNYPGCEALYAA